jgi:hypothetical protein
MKLLIFKLLIATTCITSPSPCYDHCGFTVVNQGHWNAPVVGQALVHGHWVKTKVRTWSPTSTVSKCW